MQQTFWLTQNLGLVIIYIYTNKKEREMTVADLIKLLHTMPLDLHVGVSTGYEIDSKWYDVDHVRMDDGGCFSSYVSIVTKD
jgi:hypothetical protein